MKLTTAAAIAVLAGISVQARQREQNERTVRIFVIDHTPAGTGIAMWARMLASAMFARIDVRTEWHLGEPSGREPRDRNAIVIEIVKGELATDNPGAFAYAAPYEGTHIKIFYDRISLCSDWALHVLLAHIMVHEIAHILEGTDSHSQTGIMKAHWDGNDLMQMRGEPLPFAPEDVRLIDLGLKLRAARTGALVAGNPPSQGAR